MEEEIKNHNCCFSYPVLVCNPLNFVLKLVHQKKYKKSDRCLMPGFAIYLLIEASDEMDGYVGKYIHTFTDYNNEHLIRKRVRMTFKGLKEDGRVNEDVGDKMMMMVKKN